jgi:hypothetical protein
VTALITRLGERMINAFVPQEKAEAAGSCEAYGCSRCKAGVGCNWGSYGYDSLHGTYCWYCTAKTP